jgi:Glycosyltransferase family 87
MPQEANRGRGSGIDARALAAFPTPQGDGTLVLPRWGATHRQTRPRRQPFAIPAAAGPIALAVLFASCVAIVVTASGVPSVLVQGSGSLFPGWLGGPLNAFFAEPIHELLGHGAFSFDFGYAYSAVFLVMLIAYAVVLCCARTLSMRAIAIAVAAMYAVILLSPPLELSDLFNYLGYARLGALHGLNPYTHVMANEHYDPVSLFVTWHHWSSPYGPLFTLLTYPLGGMSLSGGYWVMKAGIVLFSAGVVALVWQCAQQLGRDPRFAVLLVAVNPIVLIYEIGGFHNDPVMLVPALGAISLLLARRYRWAGAALAAAVAVKFTALLLLPFLIVAARPAAHRLQVLMGAGLAAVPLAFASWLAFGVSLPNAADQSTIVTSLSVVNVFGVASGLGGATPGLEAASKLVLAAAVAGLVLAALRRGSPDWLSGAGWATLALLLCMSWLMPWYVIWVLPLAALSTSRALRRAALLFTAFAALTFLPVTGTLLADLHVSLMGSRADRAANIRLGKLMR